MRSAKNTTLNIFKVLFFAKYCSVILILLSWYCNSETARLIHLRYLRYLVLSYLSQHRIVGWRDSCIQVVLWNRWVELATGHERAELHDTPHEGCDRSDRGEMEWRVREGEECEKGERRWGVWEKVRSVRRVREGEECERGGSRWDERGGLDEGWGENVKWWKGMGVEGWEMWGGMIGEESEWEVWRMKNERDRGAS